MRLFIAHHPPEPVVARLASLAGRAGLERCDGLRMLPTRGWHVTLRFLGEVDPSRVPAIAAALAEAARQHGAIEAEAGPVGAFPSLSRAKSVHLPVGPDGAWTGLARRIDEALATRGFAPSAQVLRPHVTVARAIGGRPVPLSSSPAAPGEAVRWRVEDVALVRSHLSSSGAEYEALAVAALSTPRG